MNPKSAWAQCSLDDRYAAHVFMPIAAEHIAEEKESPSLVGGKAQARDPAGNDVGTQFEVGQVEAHRHVGRGKAQRDGLALFTQIRWAGTRSSARRC